MVLGAIASAHTGASMTLEDVTSYDSFVAMVPECSKPCFDKLVDDYLFPGCGDVEESIKPTDIACICTTGSDEDAANASKFLASCLVEKCGDSIEQGNLVSPSHELAEWCSKAVPAI
ncbi:hypothetical protein FQN54_004497 [Arachnomyces sp. PD_36]|nr:hypothetical protein FQN54_004497 [Arachnomyces sp. PD_36]